MSLTAKREKFIQEIVKGKSQREAYRTAYPKSRNWKDASVDAAASNMLRIDKVSIRLQELQGKVQAAAEEKCVMTAVEVLQELSKIAKADIKDFLEFETTKTVVEHDKETGEPIIDYGQIVNVKDSSMVDGSMIQEVSINSAGKFTFKLHDKMAALDKLGKYHKLFTDKIETTEKPHNPYEELTTEELKRLANVEEE